MKLHFTREWLRAKISSSREEGVGAGVVKGAELRQPEPVLEHAFGSLVRLLRKSVHEDAVTFAKNTEIDLDELKAIEHNWSYLCRPRTVHKIGERFKLPTKQLLILAGGAANSNGEFAEKAVKFAAKSDEISRLTPDERVILNEFISWLARKKDVDE